MTAKQVAELLLLHPDAIVTVSVDMSGDVDNEPEDKSTLTNRIFSDVNELQFNLLRTPAGPVKVCTLICWEPELNYESTAIG